LRVEALLLTVIAISAATFGAAGSGRRGLAHRVIRRAPLPLPDNAADWLVTTPAVADGWRSRLEVVLILMAVAGVIAVGIVLGYDLIICLGFALLALLVLSWSKLLGRWLATPRGPIAPLLVQFAETAREASARLAEAGDNYASAIALSLAEWIEVLSRNAPHLTNEMLRRYFTPSQIARILDSTEYVADLELWLMTPAFPLYPSPEEDRRVTVLEEARQEMLEEPGPARVRELIERLTHG
jgi:hypothetical protein